MSRSLWPRVHAELCGLLAGTPTEVTPQLWSLALHGYRGNNLSRLRHRLEGKSNRKWICQSCRLLPSVFVSVISGLVMGMSGIPQTKLSHSRVSFFW